MVRCGPTREWSEAAGPVYWGWASTCSDRRYARVTWAAYWGQPPSDWLHDLGDGLPVARGTGWGAVLGVVSSIRQDQVAAWAHFARFWGDTSEVTKEASRRSSAGLQDRMAQATRLAQAGLHLHPDLAEAEAAHQAARQRVVLALELHMALLRVARAGWDKDAEGGHSQRRGFEPVLPLPSSIPLRHTAPPPTLQWSRWPDAVLNTRPLPKRVERHGLSLVCSFVTWCSSQTWTATASPELGVWELLGLWALRNQTLPGVRNPVEQAWWQAQHAFFTWFLAWWDTLGTGALIPGPHIAGPDGGPRWQLWDQTGDKAGVLAFRSRALALSPHDGLRGEEFAAEVAGLFTPEPSTLGWKEMVGHWRAGTLRAAGGSRIGTHPQAKRGRCPDCLEPWLRCPCQARAPALPWHWLQESGTANDQAGAVICRRCLLQGPRAGRSLWSPACMGEEPVVGPCRGWRGGRHAVTWWERQEHPPRRMLYDPARPRPARIPIPVPGRPPA